MNKKQSVGLIGVGLLGTALAERLLLGGFNVIGYDVNTVQLQRLQELGGQPAPSSQAVFDQSSLVVLSLPTLQDSASVVGAIDIGSSPVECVIDTTTGSPNDILEIHQQLGEQQVTYLDATVGGSSQDARNGEAVLMIGGDQTTFAKRQDEGVWSALSSRVFFLGPAGNGAKMKLVVNLVLGLERAVLGEGLAFAEALNIDTEQALAVLQAGPAQCRPMETKGHKMLARQYQPQARLRQHKKDVGIILETGEELSSYLPLSRLHLALLQQAEEMGYGEQDNCSIIEVFRAPRGPS